MKKVILAMGFAGGQPCPHEGQYLKSFDFDAYGGLGFGEFTPDITEAKIFDSFAEAMDFWKTTSTQYAIREDGKPNRPLTALTVSIEDFDI